MSVKAGVVLALRVLLLACLAGSITAHAIDGGSRIDVNDDSPIRPESGSVNVTSGGVRDGADPSAYPIAGGPWRADLSSGPAGSREDGDLNATTETSTVVDDGYPESNTVIPDPDDAEINVSATESPEPEVPSESPEARVWVQKIAKKSKGRSLPTPPARDAPPPIQYVQQPAPLGQAIAGILYGAPWSTNRTSPQCANDMRVYYENVKNFTLWAAKSECIFF